MGAHGETRFAPRDAVVLLLLESRAHPLHLGALQLFRPPEGSGPAFVRQTYEAMRACPLEAPMFIGHPATTRRGTSTLRWSYDGVDIDYHLQCTSLPAPGGSTELFDLVSRLHSSPLDRHKPLWEVHVIDGLGDGRLAIYSKIHHALVDGLSGIRLVWQSFSTDPRAAVRVPWSFAPEPRRTAPRQRQRSGGSTGSALRDALRERQMFLSFRAPRTILNAQSGGARSCAAQSWPLARIKDLTATAEVTVNDVALAIAAGALRAYLTKRNAMPDAPLVAMVPVSLRTDDDGEGGNIAGAALCDLGTDLDDPAERLTAIHASMQHSKDVVRAQPRGLAMTLAGVMVTPIGGIPGLGAVIPPLFNVGFSNVLGVRDPLYYNGARLEGNYPLTPTLHGQAINFALSTSADSLDFGIVACRRVVPDLERMPGLLDTSLKVLERAVGL